MNRFLFSWVVLCLLAGRLWGADGVVSGPDVQRARTLVADMIHERFAAVEAVFNDRLKASMPVEKLSERWRDLSARLGPFVRIESIRAAEIKGMGAASQDLRREVILSPKDLLREVLVRCRFRHYSVEFDIRLDTANHVGMLMYGVPAPMPPVPQLQRIPSTPNRSLPRLAPQLRSRVPIRSLAFSPDGKTLAMAGYEVLLLDVPTGDTRAALLPIEGYVSSLAFSHRGDRLVTGTTDGTARLWDVRNGDLLTMVRKQQGGVSALFSPDDSLVAITGSDGLGIWDLAKGSSQPIATMGNVTPSGWPAQAISPDGMQVAYSMVCGCKGGTTFVWDRMPGGKSSALLFERGLPGLTQYGSAESKRRIYMLSFSPDGKTLAAGATDGIVRLWDMRTGAMRAALEGHQKGQSQAVVFSPSGNLIATAETSRYPGDWPSTAGFAGIRVWDTETGKCLRTLAPGVGAGSLAFSPDGTLLAAATSAGPRVWAVASPGAPWRLDGPIAYGLAFSPDGTRLATGHNDGSVRLWDPRSRQCMKVFPRDRQGIGGWLARSPDGRQIADVGGRMDESGRFEGGAANVWDTRTGKLAATLHSSRVLEGAVFCDEGRTLVTADGAGVRAWDSRTGLAKRTLMRPDSTGNGMPSLTASPDGKRFALGWWSFGKVKRTAGVWDALSGQPVAVSIDTWNGLDQFRFARKGEVVAWFHQGDNQGDLSEFRLCRLDTGKVTVLAAFKRADYGGPADTGDAWGPAISADGTRVALGWAGSVRIWDARSGIELPTVRLRLPWLEHWEVMGGMEEMAGGMPGMGGGGMGEMGSPPNLTATESSWSSPMLGSAGPRNLALSPDGKLLATNTSMLQIREVDGGRILATLADYADATSGLEFSADGRRLAALTKEHRVLLWDVASGKALVPTAAALAGFPPSIRQPAASLANAIVMYDPRDGRDRARFVALPEMAQVLEGARPIEIGAKTASAPPKEWFVATPEGYFDCSANAARFIKWNVNGMLYPAERFYRRFRRPDLVRQALRGEKITAPALSSSDTPPAAVFSRLQYRGRDSIVVSVDAGGRRPVKEVLLLVNGRPLPPESRRPFRTERVAAGVSARPIEVGARPIELGARAIELTARPIEVGAKPIEVGARPIAKGLARPVSVWHRFTYRVRLPLGAKDVRLRTVAFDTGDLGSNPAELVLRRKNVRRVSGSLYALCVGIGRYRNGVSAVGKGRIANLRYAALDARAMENRLRKEGKPLYQRVEVKTLADGQATLANIRAGLKWLQARMRPGQVDTALVYLSGHGISDAQGHYAFPAHEFDPRRLTQTSLSGKELQESLGGALRAKAAFLFVDTCHSGALAGSRTDDLSFDMLTSGVYLIASSSALQYSYESPKWRHGAFTLALLRSLAKRELARDGIIRFNVLTYAVPDELAALMRAIGQPERAMEPVVPLDGRRVDEPVAQIKGHIAPP